MYGCVEQHLTVRAWALLSFHLWTLRIFRSADTRTEHISQQKRSWIHCTGSESRTGSSNFPTSHCKSLWILVKFKIPCVMMYLTGSRFKSLWTRCFSLRRCHVLLVWVLFGFSDFLPQSKDMQLGNILTKDKSDLSPSPSPSKCLLGRGLRSSSAFLLYYIELIIQS